MKDPFVSQHFACAEARSAGFSILAATGSAAEQAGFGVGFFVLHNAISILS